jgi:hypothetical protein
MFQQAPRPGGMGGKESTFQKCLSGLGTAISFAVTILATPRVFEWTREPLLIYLTDAWGVKLGGILTLTFAVVEGAIIFFGVRLIFTSAVTWGYAALAARRFPAG